MDEKHITNADKVADYFTENNLTKQHMRIILLKTFGSYSLPLYEKIFMCLKKDGKKRFQFLGKGWIGFNLPKEDSEIN